MSTISDEEFDSSDEPESPPAQKQAQFNQIRLVDDASVEEDDDYRRVVWKRIDGHLLTTDDRQLILDVDECLTDVIINAAQALLQKQYPNIGGFQDVGKVREKELVEVGDRRFVQIIPQDLGGYHFQDTHWIVVSNINSPTPDKALVYDTLWRAPDRRQIYEDSLKEAIKQLAPTTKEVSYVEVITQLDEGQSGLLAVAMAKELCVGNDPSQVMFSTQENVARNHLVKCLEAEVVDQFSRGQELVTVQMD